MRTFLFNIQDLDRAFELSRMRRSLFVGVTVDGRRPESLLCHFLEFTDRIAKTVVLRASTHLTAKKLRQRQNNNKETRVTVAVFVLTRSTDRQQMTIERHSFPSFSVKPQELHCVSLSFCCSLKVTSTIV